MGIFCSIAAWADNNGKKTRITGIISGSKETEITVNYQEYALLSSLEKTTAEVLPDGSFRCEIRLKGPTRVFLTLGATPVEEEFTLTRGDGRDTTISTRTNRSELVYLYLRPGDRQHIQVETGKIRETLRITGKNASNSRYLNEEDWRFNQYKDKHLKNYFSYVNFNEQQYLEYVENRRQARMDFLRDFSEQHKLSKALAHTSEWTIYTDAIMAKLLYPTQRSNYRDENFQPSEGYYAFLKDVQLDTSPAEKGISYFYFLDYYLKESFRLTANTDPDTDIIDFAARKLSGKPLFEYYAFALGSNFKRKLYDKFGPKSPYPALAKKVRQKYQKMEGMLEGSPAPELALLDTAGNLMHLQDLKGQYVYIDFWATWCGPCIQEIPHLDKLAEDYASRNIVFVSISMDKPQDKQKWINFVREHQLKGIQVWADAEQNKKVSQAFNILQIPRFALLDEEGNIVDANTFRPSDPKIRTLLDKHLTTGQLQSRH